jgi:hypothetical protein
MKSKIFMLAIIFIAANCSTGSKNVVKENLISRMDGLSQRPAWVLEARPVSIQQNTIVVLGSSHLTDEHKMDVSYRIAERNGKHLFQETLESQSDKIVQSLGKLKAKEQKQLADFRKEILKGMMDSVVLGKKYWEKVEVVRADVDSSKQNKVYVSIELGKDNFIKKLDQILARAQSKKSISKANVLKIKNEWKSFLASL